MKKLWPIAIVIGLGSGIVAQWGAIRRYLKIKRM